MVENALILNKMQNGVGRFLFNFNFCVCFKTDYLIENNLFFLIMQIDI